MLTIHNRFWLYAAVAALAFWLVASLVKLDSLIIVLNGVFVGSMASLIVAFWQLVYRTMLGQRPYDRVSQMTLSFVVFWIAYSGSVFISVYFRSAGMPPANATVMTAFFRTLAIIAAVMQVTAPDFGLGIFHGRDRKTLWTSLLVGLAVALFMVYAQKEEILESFVKSTEVLGVDIAALGLIS